MSKIVNPYIKDPANIKWLEENEQTFLEYMAKSHSLMDICHTILHIDTLNDAYISNLIKKVNAGTRKKLAEEKKREKLIAAEPEAKPTKIDKKNDVVAKAVEEAQKAIEDDCELLD